MNCGEESNPCHVKTVLYRRITVPNVHNRTLFTALYPLRCANLGAHYYHCMLSFPRHFACTVASMAACAKVCRLQKQPLFESCSLPLRFIKCIMGPVLLKCYSVASVFAAFHSSAILVSRFFCVQQCTLQKFAIAVSLSHSCAAYRTSLHCAASGNSTPVPRYFLYMQAENRSSSIQILDRRACGSCDLFALPFHLPKFTR